MPLVLAGCASTAPAVMLVPSSPHVASQWHAALPHGGRLGDRPLSPVGQIQDSGVASGLQALEMVDVRTRLLPVDQFRRDALDDYVFVRDAWTQRRSRQITQDLRSGGD
jgi:MlaA lipoprotein